MLKTLAQVWDEQQEYNGKVQQLQERSRTEWLINYILGTHSELGELLEQTNWKTHRLEKMGQLGPNAIEELADITKYVFSMWQQLGYSEQDMLNYMSIKHGILTQLMYQETHPPLQERNILMLDLDGVVADFRRGFMQWLSGTPWQDILTLDERDIGLHMDINNGWNYHSYHQAKIEFERDGGYATLPSIPRIKKCVNALHRVGWYIIVYTARPYRTYKRIWSDTWLWLKKHDIEADELHFGYDERVIAASSYSEENHVVALEDDPTLVKRYVGCNIPVLLCPQPYNQNIFLNSNYLRLINDEQEHWDISNAIHNTTETGSFHAGS
jgi:hypothetical protein